ncbi:MAG: winged helix-turn-helix transcriptional regulator, partial [Candidatus Rokubacteria bacterium]|nr:winged helix-turn-helix transcriptional regulator [Candidatus Rokubacteria bacterium]
MDIPLDRDKPVPLARQIEAHLERLIRERLLAPGAKLPATRELAKTLGVNRATVALAYEELVAAGWARAHVGQGTLVADSPLEPAPTALAAPAPIDWSALFSRSARIIGAPDELARSVGLAAAAPGVVSFAGGMPDSGL